MPKETPSRRSRRNNSEVEYGFEYWYQRYRKWVLDHGDKKAVYTAIALVISAALIAVSSFLPLHQTVATFIAFPAGVFFFLVPLGLLFASPSAEDGMRFKDRVPPSRRRRFAFIGSILLVVLLITSGGFLPYALGGSIMVASVLGLYNLARRTPEEIALASAGIPDPRESVPMVEDSEDEQAIADTSKDETNSPREA